MYAKRTRWASVLAVLLGASPLAALAEAPALHANLAYEHLVVARAGEKSISEPGLVADLAFGIPLGSQAHLGNVGLRVGKGEEGDRIAPHLFLRVLGGDERWKTFFDLGLLGRIQPSWSAGMRMGIGVQRELNEFLGLYAVAGAAAGFGEAFHIGFDGGIGLQLRFGSSDVLVDYVH